MSIVPDRNRGRGTDAGEDAARTARLRILMVAARFPPDMGGIETHVHEVGKRMAARGHDVHVVTTDRTGTLPACERIEGMLVSRLPAWPADRDYYLSPRLYGTIRGEAPDIIHVQGCHTLVAPIAMLAAVRARTPFVLTFHSGGHSSSARSAMRGFQWKVLAPLARRAAACIGVSRFEADLFREAMHLDAVHVVPNGCALPTLPAVTATTAGDAPLVVSIGRLERYKGHHRAIEAMPALLERHPRARLLILGTGPYEADLRTLVGRLGLDAVVDIAGIPPADRDQMARVVGNAAVVVLFSDYEAHPVAVMEALALGRPVLATHGTGFVEMAEAGLIATVPPGATSPQIARAIGRQLSVHRPTVRASLPTWDDCTDRLLELYRSARVAA